LPFSWRSADEIVDDTKQDFSKAAGVFDIIFDAIGKSAFRRGLKSLKRGGAYVLVTLNMP
jgi:NADPH:quinone reductase-like Zn-dependent oxidoreductase